MKTLKINDKESHYFDISETERIGVELKTFHIV